MYTASDDRIRRYTCSGGTEYEITFPVILDGSGNATGIAVYLVTASSRKLEKVTNYTISGTRVTTIEAYAEGELVIVGDIVLEQTLDLVNNWSGDLELLESMFDRIFMGLKEAGERNERTIRAPIAEDLLDMELPALSTRAGKALVFDTEGKPAAGAEVATTIINDYQGLVTTTGDSGVAAAAIRFMRWDATGILVLASNNLADNACAVGMTMAPCDAGQQNVELASFGVVEIPAHGYTVGSTYFVGVDGVPTLEANLVYEFKRPGFQVLDANTLFVFVGAQPHPSLFDGITGLTGPAPEHQWVDTILQFKNPDGSWGAAVDLEGPVGPEGPQGPVGPHAIDAPSAIMFKSDPDYFSPAFLSYNGNEISIDTNLGADPLTVAFADGYDDAGKNYIVRTFYADVAAAWTIAASGKYYLMIEYNPTTQAYSYEYGDFPTTFDLDVVNTVAKDAGDLAYSPFTNRFYRHDGSNWQEIVMAVMGYVEADATPAVTSVLPLCEEMFPKIARNIIGQPNVLNVNKAIPGYTYAVAAGAIYEMETLYDIYGAIGQDYNGSSIVGLSTTTPTTYNIFAGVFKYSGSARFSAQNWCESTNSNYYIRTYFYKNGISLGYIGSNNGVEYTLDVDFKAGDVLVVKLVFGYRDYHVPRWYAKAWVSHAFSPETLFSTTIFSNPTGYIDGYSA